MFQLSTTSNQPLHLGSPPISDSRHGNPITHRPLAYESIKVVWQWRRERILQLRKRKANKRKSRQVFYEEADDGYWDHVAMSYTGKLCMALHFLGERLICSSSTHGQVTYHFLLPRNCAICKNGFQTEEGLHFHSKPAENCQVYMYVTPEILSTYLNLPPLLTELLTSNSAEARHFRSKLRSYNSAMAMASVKPDFVARGAVQSRSNPTITVHGRMYYAIGAHRPPSGGTPRFASVYIHDTDETASN